MGKDETRERERGGGTGDITVKLVKSHTNLTHTHAAAYHTGRQLQSF